MTMDDEEEFVIGKETRADDDWDDNENDDWDDEDNENWSDDEDEDVMPPPLAPDCVTDAIRGFAHASAPVFLAGDGNVNYSPTSLWMALTLVATGATGETRQELETALHSKDATTDDLKDFRGALNATGIHRIADSLWVRDGITPHQEWLAGIRRCEAEVFDHELFGQTTSRRMSDWVGEHTNGMLKPNINVDPLSVLVLLNALVSDGRWYSTFDRKLTRPEPFHGTHGDAPTPMMHKTSTTIGYAHGDGWIKVTLSFRGGQGGVSIILPDESVGLDRLLNNAPLLNKAFDTPATSSWRRLVDLIMPRFVTGSTFDTAALRTCLNVLGITRAFDPDRADFSAMADEPLYIGQAIQETRMEVTEEGAKAAAYTMFAIPAGGPPPEPDTTVTVRVDRPFIYELHADLPGDNGATPLFLGVLRDPPDTSEL
ncbi:serpin family protein [Bifidobacterium callimiconis]|nr:serpin family protein [Bifidobacterium callimiconis]